MRRGDFVTIALQGDYGKPRPALIIQADAFSEHPSVTVLLVTSSLVDAPLVRVNVSPGAENGLRLPSQIMIDRAMTIKRAKLGKSFGHLDAEAMLEIERRLAVFLGIAR
jgi:mRNA interferase MazF